MGSHDEAMFRDSLELLLIVLLVDKGILFLRFVFDMSFALVTEQTIAMNTT